MKHILLFGAGKSSAVLIAYLKNLAQNHRYLVTVADVDFENVQSKVGEHFFVKAAQANVENETERGELIQQADVVISLLPPTLHYLVAVDCIKYAKHLFTASYTDKKILALRQQIEAKNLLFLCEMGLDPGIDHMSAMQLIDKIKGFGGNITSFKSHCGGLVAPESDDNPWHYKISWNPKNIILAGKSGAVFKEDGEIKQLKYEELFVNKRTVNINEEMQLSYYPNRDSISYISLYHLENAATFIRTTLRHPDFCFGWKNIVDLKLTDETIVYDTTNMSLADFYKAHFDKFGFNKWLHNMLSTRLSVVKDLLSRLLQLTEAENELKIKGEETDETIMLVNENGELDNIETEDLKEKAALVLAAKMHEANLSLKQLFYLGLNSDELINQGTGTAATILQYIIEKKLALQFHDKDMVVMMHEIAYEKNGTTTNVSSSLIVKGEDNINTAMAATVGLPLGIAAKLLLEGNLSVTGLQIPIIPEIYNPVLKELQRHGIIFVEKEH